MFYLTTQSTHFIYGYMASDIWLRTILIVREETRCRHMGEREREMFYLTTHSTHFIYGYMASDIWLRTILIVREEARCRHMGEIEREMFYLTTHSTHFIYGYMASDIWLRTILIVREEARCRHMGEREREMFYLTTHSTHFIYGYMASDTWLRTILIVREETRCRHIGYSFRLAARVLLYAPSHRKPTSEDHKVTQKQTSTYRLYEMLYLTLFNDALNTFLIGYTTSDMQLYNVDGSSDQSFMVDPFSYFWFQPVLHDWCNKGCVICYPLCGKVHIK